MRYAERMINSQSGTIGRWFAPLLTTTSLLGGCGQGADGDVARPLGGGGAIGLGGGVGAGGTPDSGSAADDAEAGGSGQAGSGGPCSSPTLTWKTARKTTYTSYPDPGSSECLQYNGCTWAGQFAFCSGQRSEAWVASHDIAALFPAQGLAGHDLCIRSGSRQRVVTVIDTCADSDCDGCCTENRGGAEALIDLESHTDARWGLADGPLEWADLGPNPDACAE